jgi:methionyl-tRNA synthetase
LLFRKLEDSEIEPQITRLEHIRQQQATKPTYTLPPLKDLVAYEDFQKLDLRIATVLAAQKLPKADKLLQLTLDTGIDRRTVISGVAQYYQPEQLIGKQVLLLANLAPRKIRGIESHGMILFAEGNSGRLVTLMPTENVENGSPVA